MQYIIKRGDTLSEIAERYNVTVDDLMTGNPQIKHRDRIYAGDTIEIPMLGRLGKWLRRLLK